jgi:hypothetical protein
MLNNISEGHLRKRSGRKEKKSLKQYLLEKVRLWINGLLEAERDKFLWRTRYEGLGEQQDNCRNGYYSLKLRQRLPRSWKNECLRAAQKQVLATC